MAFLKEEGKKKASSTGKICFKSLNKYPASSASLHTTICVCGRALKSDAIAKEHEEPLKPDIFAFGSAESTHLCSLSICG
jgi:hypothetical protein